jgi:hypothetical protein
LNTLDMLVFTVLCRDALQRHWIPQRLGSDGQTFVSAFEHAEDDLWDISGKFLDTRQQEDVRELIATWQTEHPGQFRVEGVRFLEFSAHAGQIASERTAKSRGLMGQIRTATRTADQALLISERAFFLTQRMPELLRLQVRVGTQETLSDSLSRLENVQDVLERVPEIRPLLADLSQIANDSGKTVRETHMLLRDLAPYLDKLTMSKDGVPSSAPVPAGTGAGSDSAEFSSGVNGTIERANQLVEQSLALTREVRASIPHDMARVAAGAEERADLLVRRWIVYALLAGIAWSVVFWSGYLVVKRLSS